MSSENNMYVLQICKSKQTSGKLNCQKKEGYTENEQ